MMEGLLEKTAEILKINRSNWDLVKFGDVAIQQKETVDRNNTELTKYVKGEHMGSEDLHLREWGELQDEYLGPAFIRKFSEGDILYGSRRTYLRKVVIAPFEGITSNTTFVIKANEKKIDKRLLPFIMMSEGFTDNSIKNSKGSVNPYINWKDIAKYEFLLPPKEQQAQLAELLWAMDEVIEKAESIKYKLNRIKKSILKDLFDLNWSSETPFLNSFSSCEFDLKEFSEICSESMFGPRFSSKQYDENGSIACLRTTDMDLHGNINFETMPRAKLPEGKFREHYLQVDDILISRSGTCGLTGVFKGFELPVLPAAFIIRFRMKEDINSNYIKTFFNSGYGKTITSALASGAVQKNLTSKALLKVRIPIPQKSIQDRIVDMLDNLAIEECENKIRHSKVLQKSLINQIF